MAKNCSVILTKFCDSGKLLENCIFTYLLYYSNILVQLPQIKSFHIVENNGNIDIENRIIYILKITGIKINILKNVHHTRYKFL